jgi:hypothetical protein
VKDLRVFDNASNERFVNNQQKDYGLDFVRSAVMKDTIIEAMQTIDGEEYFRALFHTAGMRNGARSATAMIIPSAALWV